MASADKEASRDNVSDWILDSDDSEAVGELGADGSGLLSEGGGR